MPVYCDFTVDRSHIGFWEQNGSRDLGIGGDGINGLEMKPGIGAEMNFLGLVTVIADGEGA
jgi:hypothetical protein